MTKPASYPFLAIAKAYGVDYGDVLLAADYWRGGRNSRPVQGCRAIERIAKIVGEYKTAEIARACQFATDQFRRIQAGLIDWNTGEPSYRQTFGRALRPIPDPVSIPNPVPKLKPWNLTDKDIGIDD